MLGTTCRYPPASRRTGPMAYDLYGKIIYFSFGFSGKLIAPMRDIYKTIMTEKPKLKVLHLILLVLVVLMGKGFLDRHLYLVMPCWRTWRTHDDEANPSKHVQSMVSLSN